MMDMSSVIDASLTFAGVVAVVLLGISTLSSESAAAFTSQNPREESAAGEPWHAMKKAA